VRWPIENIIINEDSFNALMNRSANASTFASSSGVLLFISVMTDSSSDYRYRESSTRADSAVLHQFYSPERKSDRRSKQRNADVWESIIVQRGVPHAAERSAATRFQWTEGGSRRPWHPARHAISG
jgi:hypothetical protein